MLSSNKKESRHSPKDPSRCSLSYQIVFCVRLEKAFMSLRDYCKLRFRIWRTHQAQRIVTNVQSSSARRHTTIKAAEASAFCCPTLFPRMATLPGRDPRTL